MKTLALILTLAFTLESHAAFTQNARRYLHPRDVFNVLAQKFPVMNEREKLVKNSIEVGCYAIVNSNMNVLGVVNPAIGTPAVELPPPGFVRWLGSCGHKIVALQVSEMFNSRSEAIYNRFFPADLLVKYRDASTPTMPYHALVSIKWSQLDPALRASLLNFIVREMIGPENVIRDLGYAKDLGEVTSALAKTVADEMEMKQVMHNLLLAALMREEFLSY